MKRMLCLLFALLFVSISATACADNLFYDGGGSVLKRLLAGEDVEIGKRPIDFSNWTTDELIELKNKIVEEINTRVGETESAEIYPLANGQYIEGESISIGSYRLTVEETSNKDSSATCYLVYVTGDRVDNSWAEMKAGQSYMVNIKEGYILVVDGVLTGTIEKTSVIGE